MEIKVYPTKTEMASAAARQAADALRRALHARGRAHVIAATGASQFEFLDALVKAPGIDWSRTVFFHLDEYVGIPVTHPASFRRYLRERIVDKVRPGQFHFIEGDAADPKVESLDEACRRQQLGEGWFPRLEDVPKRAISMSIRQILDADEILCIVPDARKAQAVRDCLEGPVSPQHPASILQQHPGTTVYLDAPSAALLTKGKGQR